MLSARISAHKGVRYCTQIPLTNKESSAVRDHTIKCKVKINDADFKIVDVAANETALHVLESLYIKQKPTLNRDRSSLPLFIAYYFLQYI